MSLLSFLLPWAIGSATTLFGQSLQNKYNQDSANVSWDRNLMMFERNAALQREFAKNSIKWRVQDAKKSGIHPLAALGITPYNYQPQYIGDTSPGRKESGFKGMGQSLMRFAESMESEADKRLKNARAALLEKQAKVEGQPLRVDREGVGSLSVKRIGDYEFNDSSDAWEAKKPVIDIKSSAGVRAGFPAMKMWSADEKGWYRLQLTQDVSESLESDWSANVRNAAIEAVRSAKALWYEMNPEKDSAKRWVNSMRRLRDKTLPDPGPGAEWAWHGIIGGFKKRAKHGVRGHFYWNWKGRNASIVPN